MEVEPGTKWVYSNHGFAALGQIVEDVSGEPLDRYLRDRIFDPLGMEHTDLSDRNGSGPHLATGYVLRSRGLRPVADREVPTPGGGGMYSTTADIARYVAALLRMAANEHGSVLRPETVATMFRPHFQPDPRVPGMGLAFELGDGGGSQDRRQDRHPVGLPFGDRLGSRRRDRGHRLQQHRRPRRPRRDRAARNHAPSSPARPFR